MMLKKSACIGFIVLLAGTGLFLSTVHKDPGPTGSDANAPAPSTEPNASAQSSDEWVPLELGDQNLLDKTLQALHTKSDEELARERQERLRAEIETLAVADNNDPELATALYGENWRAEVDKYKKQNQQREFFFTLSIVLSALGGAISVICVVIAGIRGVRHLSRREQPEEVERLEVLPKTPTAETPAAQDIVTPPGQRPQLDSQRQRMQPRAKLGIPFPSPRFDVNMENPDSLPYKRRVELDLPSDCRILAGREHTDKDTPYDPEEASAFEASKQQIKSQTERIEKEIESIKKKAKRKHKDADNQQEPINSALQDLNKQLSAIREYASSQQDRVEKLQNGYDWNIIRNFCLRIIRCIDNLETRIALLNEDGENTDHLDEVRDELLFALESSGVEQYEPELNSPFRGQEKQAEAVKEKEPCEDSERWGYVARIIKAGYQYVIDEDNVKIVRAARVKLFGDASETAAETVKSS